MLRKSGDKLSADNLATLCDLAEAASRLNTKAAIQSWTWENLRADFKFLEESDGEYHQFLSVETRLAITIKACRGHALAGKWQAWALHPWPSSSLAGQPNKFGTWHIDNPRMSALALDLLKTKHESVEARDKAYSDWWQGFEDEALGIGSTAC